MYRRNDVLLAGESFGALVIVRCLPIHKIPHTYHREHIFHATLNRQALPIIVVHHVTLVDMGSITSF